MNKAYALLAASVITLAGCASVPPAQPAPTPMTQTVLFDSGSATVKSAYSAALGNFVSQLKCLEGYNLVVEGHTDNTGKETANTALSEQRASNVRMDLIGKGVPANHITAAGFGEAAPVSSNQTAEGRTQNRRANVIAVLSEQGCGKAAGWHLPRFNMDVKGGGPQGVPKYLYRNNGKEGNG